MEPDTNSYRLGDTISFTATVEHNFVMDRAQAVLQLQEESPFPDPRRLVLFAVEITEQKRADDSATIVSRVDFQATVEAELPEGEYHLTSIEGYPLSEGRMPYEPRGIILDMAGGVIGLRIIGEPSSRSGRVTERKFHREPSTLYLQ